MLIVLRVSHRHFTFPLPMARMGGIPSSRCLPSAGQSLDIVEYPPLALLPARRANALMAATVRFTMVEGYAQIAWKMLINPQSWRWTFRTTAELRTVPRCWLAASLVVDGWGDGCMVASRSSRASKHAYADGRGPGVGAKVAGFGGGKPP